MIKKSNKTQQVSLFTSVLNLLNGKALKAFDDNQKWHNQFRSHITERIDDRKLLQRHVFITQTDSSPNKRGVECS